MRFELRPDITYIYNEKTEEQQEMLSDYVARAYFSGGSVDLGLLPPAVRWIAADGLGIVLERPPQQVEINYKEDMFTICVPWTVWGMRLDAKRRVEKSYLFARPYPLASSTDELFAFPLPNMSINSAIALPSKPGRHMGRVFMAMIEGYWERPFTGAHNEMLTYQTMVPDEWIPSLKEGVKKYLTLLGEHDLESITFSPLKTAQIPTLDDLCVELDPTLQKEGPATVGEYLVHIVKRAQQMAGI